MKKCELCKLPATLYCGSDQANLCASCDLRVHEANFIVARHSRLVRFLPKSNLATRMKEKEPTRCVRMVRFSPKSNLARNPVQTGTDRKP
ncbi:unnamed protein product [Rhodiola kirilowii]